MNDCKQFPLMSRQRQICEGRSDLSLARVNQFRLLHGISPIEPSNEVGRVERANATGKTQTVTIQRHSPTSRTGKAGCCGKSAVRPDVPPVLSGTGPGSKLIDIFRSAGFEECPDCLALASKMDKWGVVGCRTRVEYIINDILPRAVKWEEEKVGCLSKLIPTSVTKETIRILIDRAILNAESVATKMTWAYGVTTVSERRDTLLPKTLESLKNAGFPEPRLFVDDDGDFSQFGLLVTHRIPRLRTFGNWILGMSELLMRNPEADRFAMFQDDFVTYKNLKEYLTQTPYPVNGYLNLYTFPINQRIAPEGFGWYEAISLPNKITAHDNPQGGYGAVGLIFSREALVTLLQQQTIVTKPLKVKDSWRRVDGCIAEAMNVAGWREFVHNPSLVQHTGKDSSMASRRHPLATSFLGEDFDLLDLLRKD